MGPEIIEMCRRIMREGSLLCVVEAARRARRSMPALPGLIKNASAGAHVRSLDNAREVVILKIGEKCIIEAQLEKMAAINMPSILPRASTSSNQEKREVSRQVARHQAEW